MEKRLTFKNGQFVYLGSIDDIGPYRKEWKRDPLSGEYVTTGPRAAARLERYADFRARKVLTRAFVKRFPEKNTVPLPPYLDPHQRDGVRWILTRSRSYLAHAPGAGKTCEAITAALLAGLRGQVVFIVPPSLTANWVREILLWHDEFERWPGNERGEFAWPTIAVIPESSRAVYTGWNAEFIVVPDSMLTRPWVLERLEVMSKRLVAVDEASRFKEPTSLRTAALFGGSVKGRATPGAIDGADYVVLMDGSPMPNRPMELWAPTIAMFPEAIDFMSQHDFGFRYCGATMNERGHWEFKHSKNEEELRARLKKEFMHVVTEAELSHPERLRSMTFMTEDVRSAEHKKWESANLTVLNLSQLDESLSQGEIARHRRELGIRKAPWIADYVASLLTNKNESILLFCWHREVAFELERRLRRFSPSLVIGGTDVKERESCFEKYQAGQCRLIIMNIAAGGRGHNLTATDRVLFAEWSWTDENNIQCEKRASRKGSTKENVRCEYIVAPKSLDEPVIETLFRKARRVKRIIG